MCVSSLCVFVQERQKSIPDDVAKDLRGVTSQMRNHEGLLHELAGTEQQVPGPQEVPSPLPAPLEPVLLSGLSSRSSWMRFSRSWTSVQRP